MAPKFLLALTLLLATAMVVRADGTCAAEHCASCADGSETVCAVCDAGYWVDEGVCQKCTAVACTACTDASTCTSCDDGYWVDDGVCQKCTGAGCTACTDASTCTSCDAGYLLADKKCVPCEDTNCKTCTPDAKTCTVCNTGYGLEEGVCARVGNSASTVAPVAIASTVLAASLIAVAA